MLFFWDTCCIRYQIYDKWHYFAFYLGVAGFSMTFMIFFFSSCCCYMAALTNLSLFWDIFSGIQDGFGPMVWIVAWCRCFEWCSGLVFFWQLFSCFCAFWPFEFFGHYAEYLRQFFTFLANLKFKQSYAPKYLCYQLRIVYNIAEQKLIYELLWRGWILSERPSKNTLPEFANNHSKITMP